MLHTLAKGAERGAHRERMRLPPVPPLGRILLRDEFTDENLGADGHQIRLPLAAAAR